MSKYDEIPSSDEEIANRERLREQFAARDSEIIEERLAEEWEEEHGWLNEMEM